MGQVRTCIGCRSCAPRSALTRVVVAENRLVIDTSASAPGRGAWFHPSADCARAALEKRAWRRALRVNTLDDHELRAYISQLSSESADDATAKVERTMDKS